MIDRELLDALGDATFIHGPDGKTLAVNTAAETVFRLSNKELAAATVEQLSAAEEGYTMQRVGGLVQAALAGEVATVEWRSKRGDGSVFWSSVRLAGATIDGQRVVVATVRDISDYKETQARLEASREQYRLLVAHLPESVIVLYDHDLRHLLIDGPEVGQVGVSKQDAFGKTASEVLPPPFLAVIEPPMRAALRGETSSCELPFGERWYSVHIVPIRTSDGEVSCGMLMGINITEKHLAETALRESEARLRAVTEHTPAFIVETDENGRIDYLNRARPGLTVASFIGTSLFNFLPADAAERFRTALTAASQGQVITEEYGIVDSQNERREFMTTLAPIAVAGQKTRVAITTLDVTEARRATAQAREAQQRLSDVAEQLPGFLFQYRLRPNGIPHFAFASAGIAEYYGVTPEEVAEDATPVFSWIHPEDQPTVRRALEQSAASLERLDVVHRVVQPSGVSRWVETVAMPLREGDGSVLWSGYALDVSARTTAETERERLIGELQASNAEMEQFTYTVSHDLKSPLVTIRSFLGAIEKDLIGGNTERALSDLKRIGSAADKMSGLLGELLELSRVGRIQQASEPVALEEVVKEALELLAGPIAQAGARVELEPNLPMVLGDRVRLVQIFQNLIENAVKYGGSQRALCIAIGSRPAAGKAQCFVRDNGIGIDPPQIERIFGLFEKLDPKSEGSGMGLTMVRRVAELHGGRVWAESEGLGKGTTIVLELVPFVAAS